MSKTRFPPLLIALTMAAGTLNSGSISAQVLPATKVSSALAPLFEQARERDAEEARRSQDFVAILGQMLVKGRRETDGTRHSTYVRLAQTQRCTGSSANGCRALRGALKSGLVSSDQLVVLARKLEELKASEKTP
jgi:hypothetical protein